MKRGVRGSRSGVKKKKLTKKKRQGSKKIACQSNPDNCVACPYISLGYPEQLREKQNSVVQAFVNEGFSPSVIKKVSKNIKASPSTQGYRNKAKWVVKSVQSRVLMGVYRPGTHEVVDIGDCVAHPKALNEVSSQIRGLLEKHEVYCEPDDLSVPALRYLVVRYSFLQKRFLLVFITNKEKVPGLNAVIEELKADSKKFAAIVQNINSDSGNVLLGENNRFKHRGSELLEKMGRFKIPVGALSFLQVNTRQAAYMYQRVASLMGRSHVEQGLDLYGGIGLFAMHLAGRTDKILTVEELGSATLEGVTTARRNRIYNVIPFCGDAADGVQAFFEEWGNPDWVTLNPPRRGCEEKVIRLLASQAPRKMVYISCNPHTLARDIRYLMEENPSLHLKSIEALDMFPQTQHVETIVLLENKNFEAHGPAEPSPEPETDVKKLKKRKTSIH